MGIKSQQKLNLELLGGATHEGTKLVISNEGPIILVIDSSVWIYNIMSGVKEAFLSHNNPPLGYSKELETDIFVEMSEYLYNNPDITEWTDHLYNQEHVDYVVAKFQFLIDGIAQEMCDIISRMHERFENITFHIVLERSQAPVIIPERIGMGLIERITGDFGLEMLEIGFGGDYDMFARFVQQSKNITHQKRHGQKNGIYPNNTIRSRIYDIVMRELSDFVHFWNPSIEADFMIEQLADRSISEIPDDTKIVMYTNDTDVIAAARDVDVVLKRLVHNPVFYELYGKAKCDKQFTSGKPAMSGSVLKDYGFSYEHIVLAICIVGNDYTKGIYKAGPKRAANLIRPDPEKPELVEYYPSVYDIEMVRQSFKSQIQHRDVQDDELSRICGTYLLLMIGPHVENALAS